MPRSPRAIRRQQLLRRAEDPRSPLPLVAIVGRPNVGKSTLFNRLVGGHNAIVEDEPGVTRDRRYGETDYAGRYFRVVDTGGLESKPTSPLAGEIQKQALRGVAESSLVLFVVDAQHGIVAEDREVLSRLRPLGKPILFVANKVDGARHESLVSEVYALGASQVYGISAAHGRGMPELLEDLIAALPPPAATEEAAEDEDAGDLDPADSIAEHIAAPDGEDDEPADGEDDEPADGEDGEDEGGAQALADDEGPRTEPDGAWGSEASSSGRDGGAGRRPLAADALIRIAFVGRPNAGKSSLVNALLGDERMIVSDIPGTTRDPVDTLLSYGDRRFLLIDTAGIRRRARIPEPMEKVAVAMAEKALLRADVAVLVIDGKDGIGEQDARIAGLIQDSGRALVIVFNKADLLKPADAERLREDLERKLQFVAPWALVTSCSAKSKKGIHKLLDAVERSFHAFSQRVSTGALNRFFEGIVERHPPPLYMGRPIRLYYITQAEACPPTFVVQVNHPEGMHYSYRRYLQNQLRETFKLQGTPVRLVARARTRA
jgi:GTP-binding protein